MRPLVKDTICHSYGNGQAVRKVLPANEKSISEVNSGREELALEAASYHIKTEEQNVAPTPRNLSLENVKKNASYLSTGG